MAAKLIPLREWAHDLFGEHAPHYNSLLNWIKRNSIMPRPIKVGRRYLCDPKARYIDPVAEKIGRMADGR